MITANDIREVTFSRTMGGYKTAEVDAFLDRCAEAVDELTKENTENTKKMQVLAETIVDYRNQEDSIRSALISAQRMSESVIADAKKQAEEILAAARDEAAQMHEKALEDTAAEQAELARMKQEVANFKSRLFATYREHLTILGILDGTDEEPQAEKNTSAPVEEEYVPAPVTERVASSYDEVPDISAFEFKDDEE